MRKILFFVLIYLIYQVGNAAQSREHCLVIPTVPIYNFDMSSFGNATIVSGFHTQMARQFNYLQKHRQSDKNIGFGTRDVSSFTFNINFPSLRNRNGIHYIVNGYNGNTTTKKDEFSIHLRGKFLEIQIEDLTCQTKELLDSEENSWIHYTIIFKKEKGYVQIYKNGIYEECHHYQLQSSFKPLKTSYDHLVFGSYDTQDPQEELENRSNFLLEEFFVYDRKLERSEDECLRDICQEKCDNCEIKSENCIYNNNFIHESTCDLTLLEFKDKIDIQPYQDSRNYEYEQRHSFNFNMHHKGLQFEYLEKCNLIAKLKVLTGAKNQTDLTEEFGFRVNFYQGKVNYEFSQREEIEFCEQNLCVFEFSLLLQKPGSMYHNVVNFEVFLGLKERYSEEMEVKYVEKHTGGNLMQEVIVEGDILKDGQLAEEYMMDGHWENLFALEVRNEFLRKNYMVKVNSILIKDYNGIQTYQNISTTVAEGYEGYYGVSVHKIQRPQVLGNYTVEMEAVLEIKESLKKVFYDSKTRKLKQKVKINVVDNIGYEQNSQFDVNNFQHKEEGEEGEEGEDGEQGKGQVKYDDGYVFQYDDQQEREQLNLVFIIGGSFGGLCVIILFVCVILKYRQKKRNLSSKIKEQKEKIELKIVPYSPKGDDYEKNSDGFDYYISAVKKQQGKKGQKQQMVTDQEFQKQTGHMSQEFDDLDQEDYDKFSQVSKQKTIHFQEVQIAENNVNSNQDQKQTLYPQI